MLRILTALGCGVSHKPEHSKRIERIQRRLWDLLPVIRDHVYHPTFKRRFSLHFTSTFSSITIYGTRRFARAEDRRLAGFDRVRSRRLAYGSNC